VLFTGLNGRKSGRGRDIDSIQPRGLQKLYSKVIEAAKQENLEIEYFDRDRKVDNDLKK